MSVKSSLEKIIIALGGTPTGTDIPELLEDIANTLSGEGGGDVDPGGDVEPSSDGASSLVGTGKVGEMVVGTEEVG